jgi:hypothetical protein
LHDKAIYVCRAMWTTVREETYKHAGLVDYRRGKMFDEDAFFTTAPQLRNDDTKNEATSSPD